jgi:hypothetical protein
MACFLLVANLNTSAKQQAGNAQAAGSSSFLRTVLTP